MTHSIDPKSQVYDFWNSSSCGEIYARGETARERFDSQAGARYSLEPYIKHFARFADAKERDILEIGVGMGADHVEWAKQQPRSLTGIDLTPRAVEYTRERMTSYGFISELLVGDAEVLQFEERSFDIVYSWGVLHHTPDTWRAIEEVYRVLRPGGVARIMVYNRYSVVGYVLWLRYALLTGRVDRSLDYIYDRYLESPGTKAYSIGQARLLFASFSDVKYSIQLSFGDLLQGAVGQRHTGALLRIAKRYWPRWFIRRFCRDLGLYLMIEAIK